MSSVPAVIAALVALGEATLNTDEFQVVDGPPDAETQRTQRLFTVGEDEILSPTEADSYGAASMAERYTVPLTVSVALPGGDTLATARTEAFAAYEDICNAILTAPGRNLGLTAQNVVDVVPGGERRVQQFATDNGRSVAIRFGAEVYAQT